MVAGRRTASCVCLSLGVTPFYPVTYNYYYRPLANLEVNKVSNRIVPREALALFVIKYLLGIYMAEGIFNA